MDAPGERPQEADDAPPLFPASPVNCESRSYPADHAASHEQLEPDVENEDMQDIDMSESEGGETPGEADDDYDDDAPSPPRAATSRRSSKSTTGGSTTSRKRQRASKAHIYAEMSDEDDDIVPTGKRRRMTNGRHVSSSTRPSPDDSDDYSVASRIRASNKVSRNRKVLPAYSRFSSRMAGKVTNYNEDEAELDEDELDDEAPTYYYVQPDNSPAIDAVLNHKLKDDADSKAQDKDSYEFYIKWQGQAHYHATWKTWAELSGCKGVRRLENYFRKIVKVELAFANDPAAAAEDMEKWNLDREAYLDSLNDYMQIERVINEAEDEDGIEYFVKWKGLFYDACTWESASLVNKLAPHEIDRYLDRVQNPPVSNAREANLQTRSDYTPFHDQPSYIHGGQLRGFQIAGINFLAHNWCSGKNVILADEMGLGKTVQTVSFISWLRHERGQQGPFIVVVPLSTMPAWADTFNTWAPDTNYVVYNGNEAARRIIREYEMLVNGNPKKVKFNVLLTTYEYILADSSFLSQIRWQFMAVDEAHRLKNRDSQLYQRLMEFKAPSRLLITGTPMQNALNELSALMDFLMPGMIHLEDDIDMNSENASKKIAELNDQIKPYMIRRTKQKVENDLPPKTEKIIRVELADVQLELYKNIFTRNYAALNAGAKAQKTSLLNIMMELKKASNHPFMFPGTEDRIVGDVATREDQLRALITTSGKMMLLDRLLTKMKKDGHRVLIFSQMVRMLDILSDYLQFRGYQFQRLDGTIAAGTRRQAIDHFNAPGSQDFCFLLSTRAGGLGINLMTADTVILFDSDWNPQADLQAMARAHRIGQKNPVTVYRLVSKDTVEEEVLERAKNKLLLEFVTIQRGITDKDAQELSGRFARAGHSTAEPTSADDISRILKKRGQKMFEQSGNQRRLEELDVDAVLANAEEIRMEQPEGMTNDGGEEFLRSFEFTDVKLDLDSVSWDEIIPKEELDKIQQENVTPEQEETDGYGQRRKRKAGAMDGTRDRRSTSASASAVSETDSQNNKRRKVSKRALEEKECRLLINAYERWGSFDEKPKEIISQARLTGHDVGVIKSTLQELHAAAVKALADAPPAAETTTKKGKKAVLFDFKGVKRNNASTITERPKEMRLIRKVVNEAPSWREFRIPEASKSANWTVKWEEREDAMLIVGMARHGFGAWTQIRDDKDLGLSDLMFLDENRVAVKEDRGRSDDKQARSPAAVHLGRRANYLVSVLKDKVSNGTDPEAKRATENHHRNKPKNRPSAGKTDSPAPNSKAKPRQRESSTKPATTAPQKKAPAPKHRDSAVSAPPPMDEDERRIDRSFEPIRAQLARVRNATTRKCPVREERLMLIRSSLLAVGDHITAQKKSGKYDDATINRMWEFVCEHYWPRGGKNMPTVTGAKLREMYQKVHDPGDGEGKNKADAETKKVAKGEKGANSDKAASGEKAANGEDKNSDKAANGEKTTNGESKNGNDKTIPKE
ncbi:hypothetical protein K470DRAFT_227700 [Piedraia hortae CBS 480.64]|uniref:Uncharacterized protein n=1 Tax=Piedraia hortae CBS 480.64 TaxID=1314780 RepID=A0A6A7C7T2_9PEZI|nr:hypothetical protein K470DRAFT_227700 [Piedraia hortae CBS 480.64]